MIIHTMLNDRHNNTYLNLNDGATNYNKLIQIFITTKLKYRQQAIQSCLLHTILLLPILHLVKMP